MKKETKKMNGIQQLKRSYGRIWQKRGAKLAHAVVFALVFSWVGYQVFAAHAEPKMPTGSDEIVVQYESLDGVKTVKQADGALVNAISPNDVLVTGDGTLYCNVDSDGVLTTAHLGPGQVKQLYDDVYTSDVTALAAQQKAHLPSFEYGPGKSPAAIIINDNSGAQVVYNTGTGSAVFDAVAAHLQQACRENPSTQKVPHLPALKNPVLKDPSGKIVALLNAFGLLGHADAATTSDYTSETANYNDVNTHRLNHVNKPALTRSGCITNVARAWAQHMADTGTLSHNPNYVSQITAACGNSWQALGENVGMGPDETSIFNALIASCEHHSNIDDMDWGCGWSTSGYNFIGVGASRDSNNTLWVTENFAACPGCKNPWTSKVSKPSGSTTTTTAPSYTWTNLGGTAAGGPGAVSMSSSNEEVFVRGTDNQLWHRDWNSSWSSSWASVPGSCIISNPAATSWANGRIDVFAQACGGGLAHQWYISGQGWSYQENLGGAMLGGPAATNWGTGRLDVFVRGTNDVLYHKWYISGQGWYAGWENLGGTLYSDPAAVAWGSGRIDVFANAGTSQNSLYHRAYASGWQSWENLGCCMVGGPGVTSRGSNQLDVYVRGTDNYVYQKTWNGKGWSGFVKLGGGITSDPEPVARGSSYENVFAAGGNSNIYYLSWNSKTGWQ
jgi:uncharacterized protein YkwD